MIKTTKYLQSTFGSASSMCLMAAFMLASPPSVWAVPQQLLDEEIEQSIPQEQQKNHRVTLRLLDKITARISEIELQIGEEYRFGTLVLVARYCRSRPPIETPETFVFLEIDDLHKEGVKERVFEGWMIASSPALSAMEHPVYDVWVMKCTNSAPEMEASR